MTGDLTPDEQAVMTPGQEPMTPEALAAEWDRIATDQRLARGNAAMAARASQAGDCAAQLRERLVPAWDALTAQRDRLKDALDSRPSAIDWTGSGEPAQRSRGISLKVTEAFREGVRHGVRNGVPGSSPHHVAEIAPVPAVVTQAAEQMACTLRALADERDEAQRHLAEVMECAHNVNDVRLIDRYRAALESITAIGDRRAVIVARKALEAPGGTAPTPDVRPRDKEPGQLGTWHDVTCGACGGEFGTNFAIEELECPECEARRCPQCRAWFGGDR